MIGFSEIINLNMRLHNNIKCYMYFLEYLSEAPLLAKIKYQLKQKGNENSRPVTQKQPSEVFCK